MIYVMECGPLPDDSWLVFSLDRMSRQTKVRAMETREDARHAVAIELVGAVGVRCCASLGEFGRDRGWRVDSVPEEVLRLAAQTLVGLENQEVLGMLAFAPAADAWLRASAMFLDVAPWAVFGMKTPLTVTFSGESPLTRVVAVGGRSVMPPSLLLLPDRHAYERFATRGEQTGLEDALIAGFDLVPGAISASVGLAYGQAFHPVLLRLRGGKPSKLTEGELLQLAGALAATASLATGRGMGRAVVDGVEVIAVPLAPESELPC